MAGMISRLVAARLRAALKDTPVVLVNGARQTGKTTLVRGIAGGSAGRYLTLDDPTTAAAAASDPTTLLGSDAGLVVIDEVQKAPGLLAAIKRAVDSDRRPGRFLLTGSADVFVLPLAAESLAGRMEVLTLHPLAQAELEGARPSLIERLFDNRVAGWRAAKGLDFHARLVGGGFPEAVSRAGEERRRAWFDAYVTTVTQRDVRDLAAIEGLVALPRLLSLMAARSGALMNAAELSRASGIAQATLRRYQALLEATFLVQPLPAWHENLGKRLIKAPKCHLVDSGLAAALCGADSTGLTASAAFGGLLETFVLGELRRLLAGLTAAPRVYHYRSAGGAEVDFVLEDARGRIVAIEVKATRDLGERHFAPLRDLRDALGERFAGGAVLYGGAETLAFGPRLHALPIGALWSE